MMSPVCMTNRQGVGARAPRAGGSPWSCRRQSPTTKTCVMSIFVPGLEAQEMDVRRAVRMPVVGAEHLADPTVNLKDRPPAASS